MTNNYELNDEELVDLTNENSPNQRCLNSLMIEVYKWLNGLSSDIMNDVLAVSKHRYNTRYYNLFLTDHPKRDSLIAILNSELNFNFFVIIFLASLLQDSAITRQNYPKISFIKSFI